MSGRTVSEPLADSDVKAIVLDVDSPGGVISGVAELAGELRGLRGGAKPIVAHADYLVASAAYWIASQADEIIATPSALVGSVGVYSMHVDQSGWLEQLGIKVTLVAEPAQKVEGNPFDPLGADAEAHMLMGDNPRSMMEEKRAARSRPGLGRTANLPVRRGCRAPRTATPDSHLPG
jgi:ClpP class serine protease